jgi:SPW repeat
MFQVRLRIAERPAAQARRERHHVCELAWAAGFHRKEFAMALPVERGPVHSSAPRILQVILGAWLFISAFLWPHSSAEMTNTWVLGVMCVIFALVTMAAPWARYLNTVLAVWLFISAWAIPDVSAGTVWNNVLVAIAIFIVSLVPSSETDAGFFGRGSPPKPA